MKQKPFEPDSKKHLYTINIDVYENCSQLAIVKKEGSVNYHHLIGVLDTVKRGMIETQREINIEHLRDKVKELQAQLKEKNKKKSK